MELGKLFTSRQNSSLVQVEGFADDKLDVTENINILGYEHAGYQDFLSFCDNLFKNLFSLGDIIGHHCAVTG